MTADPHGHLDALAAAEAARSPRAADWIGARVLTSNLLAELRRVVDGGPLTPATHLRWREAKLLSLADGHVCLAAAGAYDGSDEAPCVAVFGLQPSHAASLSQIAARAAAAFSDAPAQVRFFTPAAHEHDGRPHPELVPGKRLFASPIARVQALTLPRGAERVHAEPATDLAFYDEYAKHYLAWQREHPELAVHVRVEPREALEGHLRDGLLFLLRIDGRPAGVMAAHEWTECGLHGYRIAEEFLYPEFRGQGLAAAVQRRFVDRLDGALGRIVYGWIHPMNTASMRTAARAGREDIGGHGHVPVSPRA